MRTDSPPAAPPTQGDHRLQVLMWHLSEANAPAPQRGKPGAAPGLPRWGAGAWASDRCHMRPCRPLALVGQQEGRLSSSALSSPLA